jgi:hypothetical protein
VGDNDYTEQSVLTEIVILSSTKDGFDRRDGNKKLTGTIRTIGTKVYGLTKPGNQKENEVSFDTIW